jgi:hypothetical protein
MGFDLFLLSFQNGESSTFPISLVERRFGAYATSRDEDWWVLEYPDGGYCEVFIDATGEVVETFMVARPPASLEFWQALFELLRETPSCLCWPGGGPLIANPSVRDQLPKGKGELGEPTIVSTPEQICEAIWGS